jgi:hypothetical protein
MAKSSKQSGLEKALNWGKKAAITGGIILGGLGVSNKINAQTPSQNSYVNQPDKHKTEISYNDSNSLTNYDKINPEGDFSFYANNEYSENKKSYETNSTQSTNSDVYIANPFIQPNDTTLNWYASGDSNGDDTLTIADLNLMQEYINGTYTPDLEQDRRALDRMDVNLDQVIDQQDKNMLEQHLTNPDTKFFQPFWYFNKLETRSEREEYLQKALDIDKTNEVEWGGQIPGWACEQYMYQAYLNFHGWSQEDLEILKNDPYFDFDYTWEDNGRFNLPLYLAFVDNYKTEKLSNENYLYGHAMNTSILGNKTLKWESSSNVEPQRDRINIQPGEAYLGENATVKIRGPPENPLVPYISLTTEYFEYEIRNKIPELTKVNYQDYYVLREERDTINPEISTTLENGSVYEAFPETIISVNDKYFKKSWVSFNDGQTKRKLVKGNNVINENLPQGDYEMIAYVGDESWNEVLERRNFSVNDTIAPRVKINSPLENAVFEEEIPLNASVSDPNINPDSIYYRVNGGDKVFFNGNLNENLNVGYGDYTLKVVGVDNSNNRNEEKVNFSRKDLTAPEINWEVDVSGQYANNVAINWDISDKNFESAWLSKNGEKQEISQTGNIEFNDLPNGNYEFWIGAKDSFGNADSTFEEKTVTGVGLEDKLSSDRDLLVYPNPVNNLGRIKYAQGKTAFLEFFDVTGKRTKQIIDEDRNGESEFDFSLFKPGMYIIKAEDENGQIIGTGKFVKE